MGRRWDTEQGFTEERNAGSDDPARDTKSRKPKKKKDRKLYNLKKQKQKKKCNWGLVVTKVNLET